MIKYKLKGFPDYTITKCGKIFNRRGKSLKFQINVDGYYVVNLIKEGKKYHKRRARLLAQTFIENPLNLPMVNHIDYDRQNDDLSNLEWVTAKENSEKSHQLQPHVYKQRAKVTEDTVHKICSLIEEGYRNVDITSILDLSTDTVKHIRRGNTWREVSSLYTLKPSTRGISEATVRWVCHKINDGLSNKEILELSECKHLTRSMIKRIRSGETWKDISKEILNK